jgi:hypothetical protein
VAKSLGGTKNDAANAVPQHQTEDVLPQDIQLADGDVTVTG